ncbi:MAG: MBL fold metallo-hydrolase [Bryobacteraceae bacterium]|nr:MBL fold metallo-hydrolase [Bryobacteraceae bacterium]
MTPGASLRHDFFPLGPFECNCSILSRDGRAIVIDPGDEFDQILSRLAGLTVERILLTHAHIDHVGAVAALKRHFGVAVAMHPEDRSNLEMLPVQAQWTRMPVPESFTVEHDLASNEILDCLGQPMHVLFTPGHSPGSVSFYLPEERKVISGDALFRGSIGRTDLPGGDHELLIRSIKRKLLTLPAETEVFPGHGEPTTIGVESQKNPFLSGRA